MEDRHIVAIDLGSSKFVLAIAKVSGDDIQIEYYRETPVSGEVRYSSVFNITKTVNTLKGMISDAERDLNIKITQAVVGMPRYSVRQETNQGSIAHNPDECITAEDINYIKSLAQEEYPLEDVEKEVLLGAVAQSFSTSEDFQLLEKDIIGMASDRIEGNFKIFIGRKRHLQNIDMVFNKLGIAVEGKFFTPDTTARAVLTSAEMDSGVAMIDFGAEATSVSIYSGSILRHYASIPFGGRSITADINNECNIFSESLAENIKLAHGICMPEKLQNMSEKVLRICMGTTGQYKDLSVKYLSDVITCRVQEIIEAVLFEIQESGFADKLRSGIVLTGGGANLAGCRNFITELSGYSVRTGYPRPLFSGGGCVGVHEADAATAIGMILAAAEEACADCTVSKDETEADTAVVVERREENADKEDKQAQEQGADAEDGNGFLFGQEEMEAAKSPSPSEEPYTKKPARQKSGWIWGRLKKAVDNVADSLYNMNDEQI